MTLNFKTLSIFITSAFIGGLFNGCASTSAKESSQKEIPATQKGDLLVHAAEGANREGDIVGALQLLQDAEKYVPKSPSLHFTRATSFYLRKDLPSAVVHLNRALELNPKFSQANNMLGKIYLDQGKYELAEKYLLLAANDLVFREGYKSWTTLGMMYYRQGHFEKAGTAFDTAISMADLDACIAHYFRGHLRLKEADYPNAIREYVASTKRQCGSFAEGHLAVATAYERSRQYDLARRKYLEIEQLFPNSAHAEQAMASLAKLP